MSKFRGELSPSRLKSALVISSLVSFLELSSFNCLFVGLVGSLLSSLLSLFLLCSQVCKHLRVLLGSLG